MKRVQGINALTKEDRELIQEHDIDADDYEELYEQVLANTQQWGTWAMSAVQKQVTADIETGLWDD